MILPIIKYPDPILRVPGKDVPLPASPATQKLVANMIDTVRAVGGIGLAAPQVGKSLNIVVVNLEHLGIKIFPAINPRIVSASKKKTALEEGCLSIPGVYGMVSRPESVIFKAQDLDGKSFEISADGMLAKVIQHEIDHTNGVLILDKIKKYTEGKELIGQPHPEL